MRLDPLLADVTGTILIAVGLVVVLGGVVGLWFVSRSAPKGTVLAIAVSIYLMSFLIPRGTDRLLHGLAGVMGLFGLIGGVLGVIDLVKKRTPAQTSDAPIVAELAEPPPSRQQVQCPKCQRYFKFRPELAGKKVKCPCGELFSVAPH
jgi:hypothetical protein